MLFVARVTKATPMHDESRPERREIRCVIRLQAAGSTISKPSATRLARGVDTESPSSQHVGKDVVAWLFAECEPVRVLSRPPAILTTCAAHEGLMKLKCCRRSLTPMHPLLARLSVTPTVRRRISIRRDVQS